MISSSSQYKFKVIITVCLSLNQSYLIIFYTIVAIPDLKLRALGLDSDCCTDFVGSGIEACLQ